MEEQSVHLKLPKREYCLDSIVILGNERVIITKEVDDASSISPSTAGVLKSMANFLDALPVVLAERIDDEKLEENMVYSRHNLPVLSQDTFKSMLSGAEIPLIYLSHGGIYVKIKGSKLREMREKEGISRGELARMVGVTSRTIINYEEGRSDVSLDVALKLEEMFGDEIFEKASTDSLKEIFGDKIKAPRMEPRDALLRSLFRELREHGFIDFLFNKAPFDAGVKYVRESTQIKVAIKKDPTSEEVDIARMVSESTKTRLIVVSAGERDDAPSESLMFVYSKSPDKIRDVILGFLRKTTSGAPAPRSSA